MEQFAFPYSTERALQDLEDVRKFDANATSADILCAWLTQNRIHSSADWMDMPEPLYPTLTIMNGEGLCEIVGIRFRWRTAASPFLKRAKLWDSNGASLQDQQRENTSPIKTLPKAPHPLIAEISAPVKRALLKEKVRIGDQPFKFIRRIADFHFKGEWLEIPRAKGDGDIDILEATEVYRWLEAADV